MNFQSGVNFDLDVVTSDSMTATTLSSLLKAGMLYKKMSATPTEKLALENVTVNSDSSNLADALQSRRQAVPGVDAFAVVCGGVEVVGRSSVSCSARIAANGDAVRSFVCDLDGLLFANQLRLRSGLTGV